MKKFSGIARWGPAAGVLAVGMLAFSLSLEGAAPSPQPPVMREKSDKPAVSPANEEGAAVVREADSADANGLVRSGHTTAAAIETSKVPESIRAGRMPKGDLPIMPPMTVDYRDDTGTRLRQAGLLVGPYRPERPEGVVAGGCQPAPGGSCSFDLQCDDKNPCTNDVCNIPVGAALNSGSCINSVLGNGAEGDCSDGLCCNGRETCQDGVCEAPGAGTGTFDPGGCQYPCLLPGETCNEASGLCRVECTGANTCSLNGRACVTTSDCLGTILDPQPEGNYCLNCNDGVNCNGVETCVPNPACTAVGVPFPCCDGAGLGCNSCASGTNPCGPGAICGERECSSLGINLCTTDSDCSAAQVGTCTRPGPICLPGRCCNPGMTPETGCTKRAKSGGKCTAGSNNNGLCQTSAQCRTCTTGSRIGNPCTSSADCAGGTCGTQGTCTLTESCDAQGGNWYATDDGDLPPLEQTQPDFTCPTPPQENPANDRTLCPKYSSGVAPQMDFDTEIAFLVGPISAYGACDHREVGDDYQIENLSPIAMEKFRWIGGGGGRLLIEFYDDATPPNFIEDVITGGVGGGVGIRSLNFLPPLTLPGKGFVVISVAANFAPNGQTFAAFANGAAEEGVNVANGARSWWFNTGPSSLTLQECVNALPDDRFDGTWCDPDATHPAQAECAGQGGTCTNRDNVMAFEIEGVKTATPTGACCNNNTGVCTPGVLPWVCTGQGNNYQGNDTTCPGTCGIGACCVSGVCSSQTAAACPGPDTPPNFLGFGTDCDPNCCTQPTVTGSNNCGGVTIQNIHVPDPGDPAVVRTLSGNNSGASGPDTCLQGFWNSAGGTFLTVDPGWWEAFHIDDCAFVRVDYCCSEPVAEPAWSTLWKGCPCDDQLFSEINPNVPNEPGNKRGSPYCDDDNLWSKFGPLPGNTCDGGANDGGACTSDAQCPGGGKCTGTYYIPVLSFPNGVRGPYQMHITVEACPVAACCDGTTCVETDQLGCLNTEGANFLAPPFRTTATVSCIDDGPGGLPDTCGTGSCCYIPGQAALCTDVITSQLVTEALCETGPNPGIYKGGTRCFGCVCASGSPAKSCNDDDDCGAEGPCNDPGGGACVEDSQNQSQPSPCPACEFESDGHCQKQVPNGYDGGRLSDLCIGDCVSDPAETDYVQPGIRVADDFVASVGGSITSVCVWGVFVRNGGTGSGANCNSSGPPEKFEVRIYNDSNGLPSTAIGPPRTTTVTHKEMTGSGAPTGSREIFQWQLALSSPIPIVQGNTYWLEVYNDTDESSGFSNCDWFWASSDPDLGSGNGNQYILQSSSPGYSFTDAAFDGADMAWCLNLDNTVPPLRQAACCTCGGGAAGCAVQTLEICTQADGSWQANEPDCTGLAVPCRAEADAADNCVTDKIAVASGSETPWNNFCANTDGPATAGNASCSAGLDAQADLWYTWTADCGGNVVIETCDPGGEFDTMLVVYSNNTGTCICPTSAATEKDCNDDGCTFGGSGSRLTLEATPGVCYTMRVAGFEGLKGFGVLHVGGCVPQTPVADDPALCTGPGVPMACCTGSGTGTCNKTRFISFRVPTNADCTALDAPRPCCTGAGTGTCQLAGDTAIRINLKSLHHVVPPYTGGPSIPYTLFEGKAVYVGPPATYIESSSDGNPFQAALTQCTPHYRDWSTVGLLHVTGSAIAPSSIYEVENVAAACEGNEDSLACLPGGASVSGKVTIKTTRWGDVETPYNPPSTSVQPDLGDIGALVNKFRSALGAPIKARALIAGGDAFGNITTLGVDLGFGHIAACVDAFRGAPYPFKMGKCATGPGACTTDSNCTGTSAPPCNLYCPP